MASFWVLNEQKSSQLVLVLASGIFAPLLRLLFHSSSTIPFHSSALSEHVYRSHLHYSEAPA